MTAVAGALRGAHRIISTIDGKDKVLKVIQYAAKLYLSLNTARSSSSLKGLARGLSAARRIYRLGRAFPGTAAQLERKEQFSFVEVCGIFTDWIDDVLTIDLLLSLGIRGREHLERVSTSLWLFTTFYELTRPSNGKIKQCKLVSDAVFCIIELSDAASTRRAAAAGQASAGLAAALLSVASKVMAAA